MKCMLSVQAVILIACMRTPCAEDEPRPTPDERARIQELVKQLGDEDFATREKATNELKELAEKAFEEIEAATKSDDAEIQRRASRLLPFALAWREELAWKNALAKTWPEALKHGELSAPLFGAAELGRDALKAAPVRDALGAVELTPLGPDEARDNALAWQSQAQEADGSTGGAKYGAQSSGRVQLTALVLLSYLGSGHTERVGQYKANVLRAIKYLISCQREDGAIVNPGWKQVDGVTHELAALALSEAAAMGRMPETVAAAQKAADYSTSRHQSQHEKQKFGFGREARSSNPDLLTTTLAAFHLKSAKFAGLKVEPEGFDGIIRFLNKVEDAANKTYSLVPGGKSSPEASFMACTARHLLGWKREDLAPYVEKAVKEFKGPSSGKEDSDSLINWFGTLAVFQQGGEVWKDWNNRMKASFVESQRKDGLAQGSWDPAGRWIGAGRVFSTVMNSMCFQVYYRYLPAYK